MGKNQLTQQHIDRLKRWNGARVRQSDASCLAMLPSTEACEATVSDDTIHLSFRSGSSREIRLGNLRRILEIQPVKVKGSSWHRVWLDHAVHDGAGVRSLRGGIVVRRRLDGVDFLRMDDAHAFAKQVGRARDRWWRQILAERADTLFSVSKRIARGPGHLGEDLVHSSRRVVSGLAGLWPPRLQNDPRVQALRKIRRFITESGKWLEADRWCRVLANRAPMLNLVHARLKELRDDPPRHLDVDTFDSLVNRARSAIDGLEGGIPANPNQINLFDPPLHLPDPRAATALQEVQSFLAAPDAFRAKANQTFVARELVRSRKLLDRIEAHPLTEEQRRAVVVDERHNLVIAAAGSGKTSVIVAKAAWLLARDFQRPSELLLLAYNRAARIEMEERLRTRLGTPANEITVRTFHKLGSDIIGKATGKRPSVAQFAHDDVARRKLLDGFLQQLMDDGQLSATIRDWFQHLFVPRKSEHDFENQGEYFQYLRNFDLRVLGGEKVKSFEEVVVANFLYLHGVRYKYEAPYEHDTRTPTKSQYKPDFHLPDYGIYIEHWGIDAQGKTAPFVDQKEYIDDMDWKRRCHEEHDTVLIDTFSHEYSKGELLTNLKKKLEAHAVAMSPIPPEDVFAVLRKQHRFRRFTTLVDTFMRHFKGSGLSFADIDARAASQSSRADRTRAQAFMTLFRPIHDLYQRELARRDEIDFEDMINRATELVETRQYESPFRYILVDEFQDISLGRAKLLKALLRHAPGTRLFAVGDDWQAIYRFAGSDGGIMRDFNKHFDPVERNKLTTTFRCPDRLASVAREFVLRNPTQIRKPTNSMRVEDRPALHVGLPDGNQGSLLSEALRRIAEDAKGYTGESEVLLISRYGDQEPRNMSHLTRQHPKLRLKWKTAHSSKGLQADYVVVLKLCSGRKGFPSEITDDSLLDMVLPSPESYPHAEERRLLYVAITRAKRQAFLLADGDSPSAFVGELIGGEQEVAVFGRSPEADVSCPHCQKGRLVERTNANSGNRFYGCTYYPLCRYTVNPCSKCKRGLPVRAGDAHRCRECEASFDSCPDCHGWLIEREGPHGPFKGCSFYPDCKTSLSAESRQVKSPDPDLPI